MNKLYRQVKYIISWRMVSSRRIHSVTNSHGWTLAWGRAVLKGPEMSTRLNHLFLFPPLSLFFSIPLSLYLVLSLSLALAFSLIWPLTFNIELKKKHPVQKKHIPDAFQCTVYRKQKSILLQ